MAGRIVGIKTKVGEKVEAGQMMLAVSAMKMVSYIAYITR